MGGVWRPWGRPWALLAVMAVLATCSRGAAGEKAEELQPDVKQAESAIKQAEQQRYVDKHGEMPKIKPKIVPYNCTNVVDTLPPRMTIHSDSCSLWKKSGHVEDERGKKLLIFGMNCLSLTPTDVDFITVAGEPAFRTSERYYDWGVKVEVMDCNGRVMAVVKENLLHSFAHTPRAEYVAELPDGTEIARSKQGSFLSDTFMVYDTQEGINQAGAPPEPLAYARLHKGSKLTAQFCLGGSWRLNINEYAGGFWADPRSREVLMVMATIKVVRDADRDSMGRVNEDRCSESFWLLILMLPLLALTLVLLIFCLPDNVCGVLCGCFRRMKYHPEY